MSGWVLILDERWSSERMVVVVGESVLSPLPGLGVHGRMNPALTRRATVFRPSGPGPTAWAKVAWPTRPADSGPWACPDKNPTLRCLGCPLA
jgi:hypothetical protein